MRSGDAAERDNNMSRTLRLRRSRTGFSDTHTPQRNITGIQASGEGIVPCLCSCRIRAQSTSRDAEQVESGIPDTDPGHESEYSATTAGARMKRISFIAFAVLIWSGVAHAQDRYSVSPAFNWTGYYAGVNLGWGRDKSLTRYTPQDSDSAFLLNLGPPFLGTDKSKAGGLLGGFQVGYNYQFAPRWLIGLEGDIQLADINSGQSGTIYDNSSLQTVIGKSVNYFGTVRGRLGFVVADRLMVFGTGGLAYGDLGNTASLVSLTASSGPGFSCFAGTAPVCHTGTSGLVAGWTAGGGLEYAFRNDWSVKAEYLYAHFDDPLRVVALRPSAGNPPSTFIARFADDINIVRMGLNYRFGAR